VREGPLPYQACIEGKLDRRANGLEGGRSQHLRPSGKRKSAQRRGDGGSCPASTTSSAALPRLNCYQG
jgi:hypothetical protein